MLGTGGRSCSRFLVGYKISPLSVLSFANCAPALGRGIGQAPIIAAYRRALPLLVWIYELSFFVPIITGGKPRSRFWAEYKISPLLVWIFAGQPIQVEYHSPPFRAGVGANTDPRRSLQGQAHAAPRFLRDAAHFPPASKAAVGRAPVYCKAQAAAEGGRRRRFALRAKPTAKPSSPPPCGGRAACGAPRRVCTRPGSQPLPQQPHKLRLFHPAQGTVPDPVRQHHRQLLGLPLFIRP